MPTQNPSTDQPNPQRKQRSRQLSSTQVMFAVIIAIGLMLAINFSTRILADRDLRNIQDSVQAEIEQLRSEQSDLIQERNFAQSDDYVALWARSEGRLVREGEILVVPVPLTSQVQVRQVQEFDLAEAETTLPRPENYQLWWRLFFDSDLP
ncbi:septum formation initiator family protein [Phototrophicus methaneseepsis]|uniref:Septum formation initiator family protein n=1 Tax=Phototrophicus methaneseepsis TaxID=2710758 RepID=A0A7S8E738_9CHLR|nr:septum formation initiator family protein [Phototrophicus methaneseepsis]QPC81518.1 septum formation initiator family protein [Phototrophicus methaneseepsis]